MTVTIPFAAQAKAKVKKVDPPPPEEVTISVPQAHYSIKDDMKGTVDQRQIEYRVSFWTPTNLTEPSFLPDTTDFQATSVPKMSIDLRGTSIRTRWVQITPVYGVAYTQLDRTGSLAFAAQGQQVHQVMNLFSARLGMQFAPVTARLGNFEPYLGIAALPTWAQAATSQFNDGISESITAMEYAVGVAYKMPAVGEFLGVPNFALVASFEATQGVLGSSLSGTGGSVSTRIGL
jgi:hypothetical protein